MKCTKRCTKRRCAALLLKTITGRRLRTTPRRENGRARQSLKHGACGLHQTWRATMGRAAPGPFLSPVLESNETRTGRHADNVGQPTGDSTVYGLLAGGCCFAQQNNLPRLSSRLRGVALVTAGAKIEWRRPRTAARLWTRRAMRTARGAPACITMGGWRRMHAMRNSSCATAIAACRGARGAAAMRAWQPNRSIINIWPRGCHRAYREVTRQGASRAVGGRWPRRPLASLGFGVPVNGANDQRPCVGPAANSAIARPHAWLAPSGQAAFSRPLRTIE